MKKIMYICLLALFLVACSTTKQEEVRQTKENPQGKTPVVVYTTVYPLQYFAQEIGGDSVDVRSIYPPGADEHHFEPTQKEMMQLADADLFFYIGLGLEGFVTKAEQTLKNEQVQLVSTTKEMTLEKAEHQEHNHAHEPDEHDHQHEVDPHVWISPTRSIELAEVIKNTLVESQPTNQEQYEENFEQLKQQLLALDQQFSKMTEQAPTKTFFVSHAAFGYWEQDYYLHQVAVAGLNSQSEPSQKQLTQLVKQAKEENIHTILFEQNISSKVTSIIQKEISAQSATLHNLATLTEEDLQNEENYLTLMERNIQVLQEALMEK